MGPIEKAIRKALPKREGTPVTEEEYDWLVKELYDAYYNEIICCGEEEEDEVAETIDSYDVGEMIDAGSQKMIDIYDKLRFGVEDEEEEEDE